MDGGYVVRWVVRACQVGVQVQGKARAEEQLGLVPADMVGIGFGLKRRSARWRRPEQRGEEEEVAQRWWCSPKAGGCRSVTMDGGTTTS